MTVHQAIHNQPGSVAVLDIGTSKVSCFIAQQDASGELRVCGIGHQLAKGIKSGMITDAGDAEHSIVAAVHAAEQMADLTIDNVMISIGGAHVHSKSVSVELEVAGDGVRDQDILELIQEGCCSLEDDDATIVHIFPLQYYLDQTKGLSDPRGMVGRLLGCELHVAQAKNHYLQNLVNCVARCHLNVDAYVLSPHASALSCLSEDERELGVTLVELGAGVSSVSVFVGGCNVFSASVPVGGKHVTSDIAQGLSTGLAQAERIKTLHGSAVGSPKDAEVMIDVPQLGEEEDEDEVGTVPRSMLVGIVRPRMEEIFELLRDQLEAAGVAQVAGKRCVLTGGGSQMLGVADLAGRVLGKQVRKGKPMIIPGLADMVGGPPFSTAIGMLQYHRHPSWEDELLRHDTRHGGLALLFAQVTRWFRENF